MRIKLSAVMPMLALFSAIIAQGQTPQLPPLMQRYNALVEEEQVIDAQWGELRAKQRANFATWEAVWAWPVSDHKVAVLHSINDYVEALNARAGQLNERSARNHDEMNAIKAEINTWPTVAPSPPAAALPSPKDGLIIATEAYSRLKPASFWVRMAGINITLKDTKKRGGHAVV